MNYANIPPIPLTNCDGSPYSVNQLIEELRKAIDNFDFDNAGRIIQQIKDQGEKLDGDSPFYCGAHLGTPLKLVSASYLFWLIDTGKASKALRCYIDSNLIQLLKRYQDEQGQ